MVLLASFGTSWATYKKLTVLKPVPCAKILSAKPATLRLSYTDYAGKMR